MRLVETDQATRKAAEFSPKRGDRTRQTEGQCAFRIRISEFGMATLHWLHGVQSSEPAATLNRGRGGSPQSACNMQCSNGGVAVEPSIAPIGAADSSLSRSLDIEGNS